MSEVKKYGYSPEKEEIIESDNGQYVKLYDYRTLEAVNNDLQNKLLIFEGMTFSENEKIKELQAKLEACEAALAKYNNAAIMTNLYTFTLADVKPLVDALLKIQVNVENRKVNPEGVSLDRINELSASTLAAFNKKYGAK